MSAYLEEPLETTEPGDTMKPSSVAKSAAETDTKTEIASPTDITTEELTISGDALVDKIKDLLHQGNVRRIIIKNEDGHTLIEIPLMVGVIGGVIGAAFFPVIAAVGVIGAMVAHLTVVIERQVSAPANENGQDD
ncbi:MAG: DUF4342 domain-containing protein [Cyanobacteria bacterium J06628_6]